MRQALCERKQDAIRDA